jgi:DNA-binding LacI/PurR family transcriptional regulator
VLVDRFLTKSAVNSVASDNYGASRELTSLLIRQGHTRILGLAGVGCSSMDERVHGYLDAFDAAGITHDPNLLIRVKERALLQPQEAVLELERIKTLAEKAGDFTACYPMNMGLQVPVKTVYPLSKAAQQPLALITYDEASEHLWGLNDHVYVVKQPAYKVGWEAAKLLLDGIHEPDQRIVQIKLKSEIVKKVFE